MDAFELPQEVGNWILAEDQTYRYKPKQIILASVFFRTGCVAFGATSPCGVNMGRAYFQNKEELIEILRNKEFCKSGE